MSPSSLVQILNANAVELKFTRRRPLPNNTERRMLATNDLTLLSSARGRVALNFHGALNSLDFQPNKKNLVLTWDIFIQDFRLVPAESVEVISVIKTTPPDEFWVYFNEVLAKMTQEQKVRFMHS